MSDLKIRKQQKSYPFYLDMWCERKEPCLLPLVEYREKLLIIKTDRQILILEMDEGCSKNGVVQLLARDYWSLWIHAR